MAEVCANCGERIGNLEIPHVFGDNVVCGSCIARLRGNTTRPATTIYQDDDWLITTTSVTRGSLVIPSRNIASLRHFLQTPDRVNWPVTGLTLLAITSLCTAIVAGGEARPENGIGILAAIAGIVFVFSTVIAIGQHFKGLPPVQMLDITTNGGGHHYFEFSSASSASEIIQALHRSAEAAGVNVHVDQRSLHVHGVNRDLPIGS